MTIPLNLDDKLNEARQNCIKSLESLRPTENVIKWIEYKCVLARIHVYRREPNLAMVCCNEALAVCSKQQHPLLWAKVNHLLGSIYLGNFTGEVVHIELGIRYLENAFEIYSQEIFTEQWIIITHELFNAHETLNNLKSEESMESVWGPFQANTDNQLCFVMMPFSDQRVSGVYEEIIKPVVERNNLISKRADSFKTATPIMPDVWRGITTARVLIAELTNFNANVYYELGLCHALNKRPILMIQAGQKPPFDLQHFRTISYSNKLDELKKAQKELDEFVKEALR